MKGLLVFGLNGQLARELRGLAPEAIFLGRQHADLSRPERCAKVIGTIAPSVIVNAAAYTAVDRAETERDLAWKINAEAPVEMARAAKALGIPFLHVSTDYVFDGSSLTAWSEDDPTRALGQYGASKLAGEQAIADTGGRWAVLRTSWVFSAHGSNFVKTMLRLGAEREILSIVADQSGGPTPARDIAQALLHMASRMLTAETTRGIYHFAGTPDVSWADFAREIFSHAGLTCEVRDIATADYPTPARRPLNSRLNCRKIERDFGISRPDWRVGLQDVLRQLKETA